MKQCRLNFLPECELNRAAFNYLKAYRVSWEFVSCVVPIRFHSTSIVCNNYISNYVRVSA